jgi:multiple sugar transport system permease protein
MRRRITPPVLLREAGFYTLLALLGLIMALPFVWSLSTSLKYDEDIFSAQIQWLPTRITLQHYVDAFTVVPFARYFGNSLTMGAAGVATNLFFGGLAGYAFAMLRFPGRILLFRILLASMMVPGVVTLIPSYLIVRSFPLAGGNNLLGQGGFGLLNNYLGVILPGAAGAFAVFLMRQFFLTLPSELGEAARLDGCDEFRIFWKIYLPLCRPALATLAIFTFQAGWNAFLWPLIIFTDPNMSTVQMGLGAFSFNRSTDYGALMAASVVVTLPVLLLFLFAQRYFTQGLAFTSTK